MSMNGTSNFSNWQQANIIEDLHTHDAFFQYDEAEQTAIRNAKPWDKDAHYFKEVKVSAVALLKMVIHSRRGGNLEVMGLMQGRVDARTIIITDSFALPVEGTETRVNAQAQAYEYMTTYTDLCEPVGRKDKVVGWYHSHPGYGCWLSGIDVSTQALNQQYQEPFVAIVIDPIRTRAAGRVEIGAFRTYPKGYRPPDEGRNEYQSIPLNKIDDFGVHCKSYYPLAVSFFKSALDASCLDSLWNTYWATTLTTSPLTHNATFLNEQLSELARKLQSVHKSLQQQVRLPVWSEKLQQVMLDASRIGDEMKNGAVQQVLKRSLFNRLCGIESSEKVEDVQMAGEEGNSATH